jgi:hypothetical protein
MVRRVDQVTNVQNLRTEIVLSDAKDVAFWFSLSFRAATFRQQGAGNREFLNDHLIELGPTRLFPKKRGCSERINFGETDTSINE